MHHALKNIDLSGIITSGEIYILSSEFDKGRVAGPIEYMYTLTRDEDILPALEMELCIVLSCCFELRRFLKWAEILDGCYEFRFVVFDKAEQKEIAYSFFLHRISTFSEALAWVKTNLIDYNYKQLRVS